MKYAEARDAIRTGDLIALRRRKGLLPWLTRLICRSPYTHTAVAVWSGVGQDRRLLVAEQKASGASLAPLSQYAGEDFDVFSAPQESMARIEGAIWEALGKPIGYDVGDLLRIAASRLLGWPLPRLDDEQLVCSALSAAIYLNAEWYPWFLPSIPAPDDVVAALESVPRLVVRPYA